MVSWCMVLAVTVVCSLLETTAAEVVCPGAEGRDGEGQEGPNPRTNINVAVILPSEDVNPFQEPCFGIRKVAPVVQIALAKARAMLPPHINLTGQFVDSQCSDTYGPLAAMKLYFAREADVFLGPCCKYALSPVARYSGVWGLPVITPGGLTAAFSNKTEFPLLTRITSSYDKLAHFLVSMIENFRWEHISLLWHNNFFNPDLGTSECYQVVDAFIRLIRSQKKIPDPFKESFDETFFQRFDWELIMGGISNNSRGKFRGLEEKKKKNAAEREQELLQNNDRASKPRKQVITVTRKWVFFYGYNGTTPSRKCTKSW